MGRKLGSRNKPKDGAAPTPETAEASGPGPGHNSEAGGELSPEARRKLLIQGIADIAELQEQIGPINSKIRNVRKELKALGFETREVNYALTLRKNDVQDEVEEFRKQQAIAKLVGHPVGTQFEMFGDGVDRTPAEDRADEEGLVAGMEGKPCHPPYDQSTKQGQRWMAAWHKGQEIKVRRGIKPLEAISAAAPASPSESFDDEIEKAPPLQGAAAFRENVAAGDQHIKDTASAMAAETAPGADDGGIPDQFRRAAETAH